MPPQPTKLTPEPDSGAAWLRFDLAIASVKDALPEKQAAGPLAASMRGVLRSLEEYWRAFRQMRRRNRLRVTLNDLSDRQLMDIGLAQSDIDRIAAHRAFAGLRDSATYLWLSRGVM